MREPSGAGSMSQATPYGTPLIAGRHYLIDESGCWIWQLYIDEGGYGRKSVQLPGGRDVMRPAQRMAYVEFVGAIPAGYDVDHMCRVRACVNPAHLQAIPASANRADIWPAWKPACKNGHLFTPENTYTRPTGERACRTCRNAASRRYQAKKKAAAAA